MNLNQALPSDPSVFADTFAELPTVIAYRAGWRKAEIALETGGEIDLSMTEEVEALYNGTGDGYYHDAVAADLIEQAFTEGLISCWSGSEHPLSDIQIAITYD